MTNEQVENVMAIAFELARIREEHGAQSGMYLSEVRALRAEVERLAAQAAPPKLWLWKNFVAGRPEYWAFDNPYPINLDSGDPQTLGEPCGYAIFKPSRSGRADFSEDEVMSRIAQAESKVSYNLNPNKANADAFDFLRFAKKNLDMHAARVPFANNGLVTAAVAWIQAAETILAAQSPAQAPVVQAVQAREYPPLPWGNQQPYVWFCRTKDTDLVAAFRAYVDADRASSGATTQAVRMLTREELNDVALSEKVGWGPGEYVEADQRKFAEVNGLRIPADGKIGDAA